MLLLVVDPYRSQYISVARDPTSKSAHILFDASFCYVAGRFTFFDHFMSENGLPKPAILSPPPPPLIFCFNFHGAFSDA